MYFNGLEWIVVPFAVIFAVFVFYFWLGGSVIRQLKQNEISTLRDPCKIARHSKFLNAFQAARGVAVLSRLDLGKMNIQLITNEEKQDRTQRGQNEASGMISFVWRARKHVGNAAADDRSDDAEHDRPEDRYVHVHHRFRDNARD
jgi:hypothetical protein